MPIDTRLHTAITALNDILDALDPDNPSGRIEPDRIERARRIGRDALRAIAKNMSE